MKESKGNAKKLYEVWRNYGSCSEEFYNTIYNFIVYLQVRYMGYFDEEQLYVLYERVLTQLPNYNPDKGNFTTYIYNVIRNGISSFHYHKQKRTNSLMEEDNFEKYKNKEQNDISHDIDLNLCTSSIVKSFVYIRIDSDFISLDSFKQDSPLYRMVLWEIMKLKYKD